MPKVTAIEFGDDACVLVRVSTRGTSVAVHGVDILDPDSFPDAESFVSALRQARRAGRFPRRARVVLWKLRDGTGVDEPSVRARLEPLIDAGFRIDRVVTPCNALAVLARIRVPRPESATIWIAVNSGGVAIIAVRPGEQLYARAFEWDSTMGAIGSQARLLQRYSLVAYLAPEARRSIQAVREAGAHVDAIVICGALPELRSLTMPLIEELDVEVETLDSLSGLTVKDSLRERLTELAPAVRLACAGALARPSRPRQPMLAVEQRHWARAVLLMVVLAIGLGVMALVLRRGRVPEQPASVSEPARQRAQVPTSGRTLPPPKPADAPPVAPLPSAPREATPPRVQTREPQTSAARRPAVPLSRPAARADISPTGRLNDPIPHVTTILVSADRRLAMVDGRIVRVGDRVGHRTVAAIEPHVVVFREPSGVEIRVALGGRLVAEGQES